MHALIRDGLSIRDGKSLLENMVVFSERTSGDLSGSEMEEGLYCYLRGKLLANLLFERCKQHGSVGAFVLGPGAEDLLEGFLGEDWNMVSGVPSLDKKQMAAMESILDRVFGPVVRRSAQPFLLIVAEEVRLLVQTYMQGRFGYSDRCLVITPEESRELENIDLVTVLEPAMVVAGESMTQQIDR